VLNPPSRRRANLVAINEEGPSDSRAVRPYDVMYCRDQTPAGGSISFWSPDRIAIVSARHACKNGRARACFGKQFAGRSCDLRVAQYRGEIERMPSQAARPAYGVTTRYVALSRLRDGSQFPDGYSPIRGRYDAAPERNQREVDHESPVHNLKLRNRLLAV
jgi:hypothetical protein